MAHPNDRRRYAGNSSVELRNDTSDSFRQDIHPERVARGIEQHLNAETLKQRERGVFSAGFSTVLTAQNFANLATWRSEVSRALAAYVRVVPTDDEQAGASALAVPPQIVANKTPVGGCAVCAFVTFGQDGVSVRQYMNVVAGEHLRVPFSGESAQVGALFVPKYFQANDTNVLTTGRTYSVGAVGGGGSFALTNENFNNPTQNMMQLVLSGLAAPNAAALTGVSTLFGSIAEGSAFSTGGNLKVARRIMYGSVPLTGVGVLNPVAWGARAVRLVAPAGVLQMAFRSPSQVLVVGTGILVGDLGTVAANTDVPMPSETNQILISYVGTAPASETCYELHYYMSAT